VISVAGQAHHLRPLSELDSWLALERFDYSRVGQRWAVLRLLAGLGSNLGAPAQARLVVQPGADGACGPQSLSYPARACALERRLLGRQGDQGASGLLWRASFAVPLEVVECPQALFEFTVPGRAALALPTPELRILTPQALRFTSQRFPSSAAGRIPVGHVRRRLVALATAVAVTTTSSPAIGLAATQGTHGGSAGRATTRSAETERLSGQIAAARRRTAAGPTATHRRRPSTPRPAAVPRRAAAPVHATQPAVTPLFSAPARPTTLPLCQPTDATPAQRVQATVPGTVPSTSTLTPKSAATDQPKCSDPAAPKGSTHHGSKHRSGAKATAPTAKPHGTGTQRSSHPGALAGGDGGASIPSVPGGGDLPAGTPSAGNPPTVPGGNPPTATGGNPPAATRGNVPPVPGAGNPPAATLGNVPAAPLAATPPTASGGNVPAAPLTAQPPTGIRGKVPTAAVRGNQLAPVGGGATAGHPNRSAESQDPSGGAPVGPLGGLSPTPPVKLSSHPAAHNTPATPVAPTADSTPTLTPSPPTSTAPQAWTGASTIDPNLSGALTNLSGLLANGNQPPPFLIPIYMEAGRRYGVPWEVLAAINAVETDYGRDLSTSSAGAIGWMQFEPASWREYGVAADGHSVANPYDPRDAIFAAARLLAAAGAAKDLSGAVFSYNHATWYVNDVLSRAQTIADGVHPTEARFTRGIASVGFQSKSSRNGVATFKGGYLWHYDRLIATANMVSAANFPYLYGGGHEQPSVFAPFDCSGAVSYVMQQAGYNVPTTVSGDIASWGFPAGPGAVTIFYNPTHTFMRIGNRFFGTSGFARPGGGAGWFDTNKLPASYLAQFSEVHVPHLGPNSFAPVAATAGAANTSQS
jgi:Transglycosylase SLT domain